jgi:glycine dehydrogenase
MSWTKVDYDPTDFGNRRHIGPSPAEMNDMLSVVGASSLDALIDETVPASIRQEKPLQWPALSEAELIAHMRAIGAKNKVMTSMIGQGYYNTHTPPAIQRNVLENPAWYTAYTPYQPEIAQGRLEALLNFQTMVADLTGLEVSNASLLDEATACAEAMVMAQRVAKSKATAFFIDQDCHPQNIAVMQTRAAPLGIELIIGDPASIDASAVFGGIFQYPGTFGDLVDPSDAIKALHAEKAIAILATDLLALTVIKEPGAMDADIAVGSAQRFGVPLGYGLWPAARLINVRSLAGWSVYQSIAVDKKLTAWRCKRESSISAVKRRRRMCVLHRRCWQSWLHSLRCSMGRLA